MAIIRFGENKEIKKRLMMPPEKKILKRNASGLKKRPKSYKNGQTSRKVQSGSKGMNEIMQILTVDL